MSEIVNLNQQIIDSVAENISRDQLFYNEYKFLTYEQLKTYFTNRLNNLSSDPDSLSFGAIINNKLAGLITCLKDEFDSENFGFSCFRITELLVFTDSYDEIFFIVHRLVEELESKLNQKQSKYYLAISLSNNLPNIDKIFNALSRCNFFYIHTLLTFSSQKKRIVNSAGQLPCQIIIRKAERRDALQVSEIAGQSIKLSRFHLDPVLDNNKANQLLKKSALNSILEGFVDVMYVAEIQNKIVGYYSGRKKYIKEFDKWVGEAVLSAVDNQYQGRGIFPLLDSYLLNWFADNVDIAEMGTYLVNYPVHKTWISRGLVLVRGMHQFSKMTDKYV